MNEQAQQAGAGRPQTKGEFLVRLSFNPSNHPAVDNLKRRFADLIDDIEVAKGVHGDPRAGSEAQTLLEAAAMFAVKMVTTPPLPQSPVSPGISSQQGVRHG